MSSFSRTRLWRGAGLGLCCAATAWLLGLTPPLRGLESWVHDSYFRLRGSRRTGATIVLVAVDGASLDALAKPAAYLSPELGEVVACLKAQGAAAIGVDLLVLGNTRPDPEIETGGGRGDARAMGRAVLEAGNVVLAQWKEGRGWKRPLPQWLLKAQLDPGPTDLGFINLTPDADQVLRRQALLIRDGDQAVPQLALALFARAGGGPIAWDADHRELRVGGDAVPLDADQELTINFAGPPGQFPVLPLCQVLTAGWRGQPLPEVKGAVVLIGATASGLADYHATPFARDPGGGGSGDGANLMSGMEVQANIMATLHDRAFLRTPLAFLRLPSWLESLAGLLVLGAACGAALAWPSPMASALLAVAFLFLWPALSFAAFALAHYQIAAVGPVMLTLLAFVAVALLREHLSQWHVLVGFELLDNKSLNKGGQAEVYRARQVRVNNRVVILKMLLPPRKETIEKIHAAIEASVRKRYKNALVVCLMRWIRFKWTMLQYEGHLLERFRREAEATARLHHDHIVDIYDLGEFQGRPTIVMEYLEGGSMKKWLEDLRGKGDWPSVKKAVGLLAVLASTVGYAHRKHIVHRDLKADNVLFRVPGDAPKIADFGLARFLETVAQLTHEGAGLGTPRYMAPEQQASAKDAGPQADVYALGVMLYQLLTGRLPCEEPDGWTSRPGAASSDTELDSICLRCLRNDPRERYATAEELGKKLKSVYPRLT